MEDRFTELYLTNGWGSKESKSGHGSELLATEGIRKHLPKIMNEYKFDTILDIGCGDWNWFKEIDMLMNYTGVDIVKPLIEENNKKYGNDKVKFLHMDGVNEPYGYYDLVIARDILFHLSFVEIFKFIANLQESGTNYFLTTNSGNKPNKDIVTGEWRELNLFAKPLTFHKPVYGFLDYYNTRQMFLFNINTYNDRATDTNKEN